MRPSDFSAPTTAHRGVTLWMLNDKLDKEEIVRQLRGFRAAGWGAVITRTFSGLLTRYLSPEWMDLLAEIVRVAKQEGLKVWFQAGYMPGGVPDLPSDRSHQVLVRRPLGGASKADALHADANYVYAVERRANVVDYLDPLSIREYLRIAYEQTWCKRFGRDFGKTIEALWVDEPHFEPSLPPWGAALPGRFRKTWGYDLEPHLASLFSEVGDWRQIRHHYWRIVLQLLLDGYFAGVRDWCEQHKVKFAGHLMGEDTLRAQIGATAAVMPCYEYMHIPGIDHLTMSLTWPSGRRFILTPKQCASAAHQLGREQVLAEMYGVSSQGITFADRKRLGEWMAVLGVNQRCFHGSFYSMRGNRKRIYAPHLSHQQPWWPENRIIADHGARLSYALRQGRYAADVLVLHPVESAFCLYSPPGTAAPGSPESRRLDALDDELVELGAQLLSTHRGFDFGDETLMARHARVAGGDLVVGKMRYRAVVLPSLITIRASTLAILRRFLAAGGVVLATGPLPERVDGVLEARLAGWLAGVRQVRNDTASLQVALAVAGETPLELLPGGQGKPGSLWTQGRQLTHGSAWFLVNTQRESSVSVKLRLRGRGQLEEWDLQTGRITVLPQINHQGQVEARLDFAPSASRLVHFRAGAAGRSVPETRRIVLGSQALPERWRISARTDNALPLDWCRFRRGRDEWSERLPVICVHEMLLRERYRGPVSLAFSFRAGELPARLHLAVEDAADWRIQVNATGVRYAGLPRLWDAAMLPVDITGLVRLGENVIEMERQYVPMPPPRFSLSSLFDCLPGTELETVHLVGDFAVQGAVSSGPQQPGCIRYRPEFTLVRSPTTSAGDLLADGHPFFAGRITLAGEVQLGALRRGERALLALPRLDATLAHVRLNGQAAGTMAWSPFELDITPFVHRGANSVELELVNTLRNLLGPHHRPRGEPDSAWGHEYTFYPDWLQKPWDREANWTDDYFVLPLGLPAGRILRTVQA